MSITAMAGVVAFLAVPGATARAAGPVDHGLNLPTGSQQVGENRYRVPTSYADTKKFFTYHKTYKEHLIISQPGIRAVNIENNGPGDWESLNVYEKDDEVRVFVIAKTSSPKKERHREK
jgi:hypothetical protein